MLAIFFSILVAAKAANDSFSRRNIFNEFSRERMAVPYYYSREIEVCSGQMLQEYPYFASLRVVLVYWHA